MSSNATSMIPHDEAQQARTLNVLVVDEEIPFPLNTGKRIRSFNLLKNLADKHNITFLCHRNKTPKELDEGIAKFQELGINIEFLDRKLPAPTMSTPKFQLCRQLFANLFSRFPFMVQKHISTELKQKVAEISQRLDVDLIHFEWTPYAAAVTPEIDKPWVADAHNVESLIWKRYYQHEPNFLKRMYVGLQWKKLDRFERSVFRDAAGIIFVSEPDSEIARDDFDCQRRRVVDNGVDVEQFPFSGQESRNPERLLFLGSLDWRPNIDGICFFLDEIWPRVLAECPNTQLDIVGRSPTNWFIDKVAETDNVTLYADVPSVQPFLERAGVMIVPLRIGGGSRLKILESAAMGLPVISTAVGAEGLDLKSGTHFIQADTADEFVAALHHVAVDQELLERITVSARKLAEERYDWPILSGKLDEAWHSAVAAAR